MTDVRKLSKRYLRQGIMLVAGMFFISLIIMRVWNLYDILNPLIISVAFSLVIIFSEAIIWSKIATKSPQNLTSFYTAVSGFRMLLALAVMLIYYIAVGRETMLTFFIVFVAFYFVLLVHHAIYFAKVSNKS
jgi:hypothetical protein